MRRHEVQVEAKVIFNLAVDAESLDAKKEQIQAAVEDEELIDVLLSSIGLCPILEPLTLGLAPFWCHCGSACGLVCGSACGSICGSTCGSVCGFISGSILDTWSRLCAPFWSH